MNRRNSILREIGLGPLWRLRQVVTDDPCIAAVPAEISTVPIAPVTLGRGQESETRQSGAPTITGISGLGWAELRTAVAECRACTLCRERKQSVFGVGDESADWLFVGEGPGAEEDQRGEPFVGQAGKLLDSMLAAIDLRRGENVYIGNAVKCRPPNNRTPEAEETSACWPFLARQIELLQPKLIVALGRPAAQTLLQTEIKIAAARGRVFSYRDIPVIVTYHPAYLLRNLPDKAKAWEDLCFMRRTMRDL